jgi:hypothetical protein
LLAALENLLTKPLSRQRKPTALCCPALAGSSPHRLLFGAVSTHHRGVLSIEIGVEDVKWEGSIERGRGRVAREALTEGIAMDTEFGGGPGEILVMTGEDLKNKLLFELVDRLFKEDPLGNHLMNEAFKIGFHARFLRWEQRSEVVNE